MDKHFYNEASAKKLGWEPNVSFQELAEMMYQEDFYKEKINGF